MANLVVSNFRALLPTLGIDGASLVSASPYRRTGSSAGRGVQIDLLLQTKTTAYVVEIKRKETIGEEIVDEIKAKVDSVGFRSGVATRTAIVYDGMLSPRVRTDHMLDFIIPVEQLFR